MALQKNIELPNGITVDNAYIRIDTVSGYKDEITISVNSYVAQQAFVEGKGYLIQEYHKFVPSVEEGSENFIKQGYLYLKTLPEFADAIDA